METSDTRTHSFRMGVGSDPKTANWKEFTAHLGNFEECFLDAFIDLRRRNPKKTIYINILGAGRWCSLTNPETGIFYALDAGYDLRKPTPCEIYDWLTCQIRMCEAVCGLAENLSAGEMEL